MNDILSFTREMASRKGYKKILYKLDDASSIKALDTQLTHAFQIFEVRRRTVSKYSLTDLCSKIQSNVSLRISQQQMVRQVARTPVNVSN